MVKNVTLEHPTKKWFAPDGVTAAFTVIIALIGGLQAWIFASQLTAMHIDQRAWLTVTQKGGATPVPGSPLSSSISIANTGKTPATEVTGDFYVELVRNGDTPHFEANVMHTQMLGGAIVPGPGVDAVVTRLRRKIGREGPENDPMTDVEKSDLDGGKTWVAVHGSVAYDDVFRKRHFVKFCFWWGPNPAGYRASGCTQYNNVDHND